MMRETYRIGSIGVVVFGLTALGLAQETQRFVLQPEESRFTVHVGTAGFLKFFGHDHLIEIREFRGGVDWQPDAPETSSIRIEVDAASLTVVDEDADAEELAQIQADMETKALELENHPQILFVSEAISLEGGEDGEYRGHVTGQITLRGGTQPVRIPLTVTVDESGLRAQGEFEIQGSDFGIEQISAGGGTVKTSDDLELTFDLVGTRE